jgi:hypothetical protein
MLRAEQRSAGMDLEAIRERAYFMWLDSGRAWKCRRTLAGGGS